VNQVDPGRKALKTRWHGILPMFVVIPCRGLAQLVDLYGIPLYAGIPLRAAYGKAVIEKWMK
jgi:hypothetical protein